MRQRRDLSSETYDRSELAARLVGFRNGARYRFRGEFIFHGIPLDDARVLEIGCGAGAWAIWAALAGASDVTGIEPEAEGSTAHSLGRFKRNVETLRLQNLVQARACTLQDLPVSDKLYDIAIMYNVINHLDEDAVTSLHTDEQARQRYIALLQKLRLHLKPRGWVIMADCGRDNLWPRLGIRSPFMPSIEWEKHQNPETWVTVFARAGFQLFDFRWSPLQPLPKLTSNRFVEYLTCSHFVLRFRVAATRAHAGAAA